MKEHHQRCIQRITEYSMDNPCFLALIIGGSIAKGYENGGVT